MGARVSDEMKLAIKLIEGGATPAEAARITGVQRSTISRSRLYRDHVAAQAAQQKKGKAK